jgi:hypothetical protein
MNKRDGQGQIITKEGQTFVGKFLNNRLDGKVTVQDNQGGQFVGVWQNGVNTQVGTYLRKNGKKESGYWTAQGFQKSNETEETILLDYVADCNLVPCGSGKGKFVFADGSVYTGYFLDGMPEGEGSCNYFNGDKYQGYWSHGKPN